MVSRTFEFQCEQPKVAVEEGKLEAPVLAQNSERNVYLAMYVLRQTAVVKRSGGGSSETVARVGIEYHESFATDALDKFSDLDDDVLAVFG
jgi:hypothetical protein